MESVKPSALNAPHKSKFARTIAKVLNRRSAIAAAGISPADGISKPKKPPRELRRAKPPSEDEEAVLAKLFAGVSCVKSAYAELQLAQTPYDADGIQAADETVVAELKSLSELKRCYLKKQFDPSPEIALAKAEILEQKSLLKTFQTTARKLEYQAMLKETELASLRETLEDLNGNNRLMEKKLNQSGQISSLLDNLHFSGLSSVHFAAVLRHAARSIRGFTGTICHGMRSSGWDLNAVARTIQPDAVFWREEHRNFAVESFVSRGIFEGFCFPNFHSARASRSSSEPETEEEKRRRRERFFSRFVEVKSARSANEYLTAKPKSGFSSFVRNKYSKLVHPKMELSLTGSLDVRTLVLAGDFSGDGLESSELFRSFSEMARRVWLLHCLAFAFEPEASAFQVSPGCRFSEVYMESVAEDHHPSPSHSSSSSSWINTNDDVVLAESESHVAFTVIPGFRIGKTVVQSKVYLSRTLISRPSMIGRRGKRGVYGGSHE